MECEQKPAFDLNNDEIDLLRHIAAFAEDIIFIINKNRCVHFISNKAQRGAPISPSPEDSANIYCNTSIYETLKDFIEAVFMSGRANKVESSLGLAEQACFHTALNPIKNQSGETIAVLGIARDISQYKGKEKLISESRMEWLQAVDTMPYLFAVVDKNYRIRKANRALANKLGVGLNELFGRLCYEAFGAERPHPLCPLRGAGLNERKESTEFYSNDFDQPFLVNVSPITNEKGNTTGCLYIARPVSSSSSDSHKKKKNVEYMKLLMKGAEYIITVQNTQGKYLYMSSIPGNARFPEPIMGKTPLDFFDTETACRLYERIQLIIARGKDVTVSNRFIMDGETLHFFDHVSLIRDDSGAITSVVTTSRRMSEHPADPFTELPNEVRKDLTKREVEILRMIASGLTTSQIAEKLFISKKTVDTHRARMMQKLGVNKASSLVRYAGELGLL